MTENPGIHVLTDARWAELEPLINEVRPPCKVPHDNLRETIEAILWRTRTAPSGGVSPASSGPGGRRRRPSSAGRISGSGSACSTGSSSAVSPSAWPFFDGTTIRAHQKAAGADKRGAESEQRDRREALGRSRGGDGT